MTIMVKEWQLW